MDGAFSMDGVFAAARVRKGTFARDTPSRSNRYGGTAPSGMASSFLFLFFFSSCIAILRTWQISSAKGGVLRITEEKMSRFLHLSLLRVTLLIEKLGTETVRLLSKLGTLVHHTRLSLAPVERRMSMHCWVTLR